MIQIDAIKIGGALTTTSDRYVFCNLYTEQRCVKIIMAVDEYENLINDGFFIRDGKTPDSAGVINTTSMYKK